MKSCSRAWKLLEMVVDGQECIEWLVVVATKWMSSRTVGHGQKQMVGAEYGCFRSKMAAGTSC